jgi:CDP-diacylglycerol pyrophosphatase
MLIIRHCLKQCVHRTLDIKNWKISAENEALPSELSGHKQGN